MNSAVVTPRRIPNSVEVIVVMAVAFGLFIYRSTRWTIMTIEGVGWLPHSGNAPVDMFSPLQTILLETIILVAAFFLLRKRGWSRQDLILRFDWQSIGIGTALFLITLSIPLIFFYIDTVFTPVLGCFIPSEGEKVGGYFWLLMMVIDPFYHEFFLSCYLFKRLASWSPVMIVGISTLIRVSCYAYIGPVAWIFMLAFGIIVGWYYYHSKNLAIPVIAHGLWNFIVLMN